MAERAASAARVMPVSVVVLTFNEGLNLDACLMSVSDFASAAFVVDSGSTDDTRLIAERRGAHCVTHAFETHTRQWAWALANLPLETEWVLALDADQRFTPELADDLVRAFSDGRADKVQGFFLNRRQVFRGRWIRHGGYYPKYLLKMFRRSAVAMTASDLVDHHFTVTGAVARLHGDLIEDNRNEAVIRVWTDKHNRYAALQARQEIDARQETARVSMSALSGAPDVRTKWLKQQWARLPLFVRPCLYFLYRYILRLGFLDGREGFVFHVLQGFWYRLLVDINIRELEAAAPDVAPDTPRALPRRSPAE